MIRSEAVAIDPQARQVRVADGTALGYDRLVLTPGIDFRWISISGSGESAAERMPHAWKAADQTPAGGLSVGSLGW